MDREDESMGGWNGMELRDFLTRRRKVGSANHYSHPSFILLRFLPQSPAHVWDSGFSKIRKTKKAVPSFNIVGSCRKLSDSKWG